MQALEPGLDRRPARAVDHDRDACDVWLGCKQVEERRHRLLRIEQVGVHVDVEDVRAAAHLLERDVDRALEVSGFDQSAEARRAGDVRALADHHESRVGTDRERLEAAETRRRAALGDVSWGQSPDSVRDRPGVFGRGSAAAACDVQEAVHGELAQQRARHFRPFVVAAERVRQPGVRVT